MEETVDTPLPDKEPRTPFAFLADAKLSVEKLTTRTKIRKSHLALRKITDPHTDEVLRLLEETETTIDGWVTTELRKHAAYHWFSRIKGIGNENIAKVLGPIDITRPRYVSSLWKYAGMHVVEREISVESQVGELQRSLDALQSKLESLRRAAAKPQKETEEKKFVTEVMVGRIITHVSQKMQQPLEPLMMGCGPKPTPNEKLNYNKELRTMCFRLGGSLIKAQGAYAKYYDQEKAKYLARYANQGIEIIPTLELPKDGGKFFEPVGTISVGHVHMQAMRKMIKLFLSHLWQVWREAENLPLNKPYAHAKLGHVQMISPWDMCERPAKSRKVPKPAVA